MDLQAMLVDILNDDVKNKLNQKTGLDSDQLSQIINLGLPMILGGMAKNATTDEGAESLDSAIAKDHMGTHILEDSDQATADSKLLEGSKILGHVFGTDQPAVGSAVSQKTGIDSQKIMQVLAFLAPLVMAYLAKKKASDSLDKGGLSDMLTKQTSSDGTSLIDIVGSVINMFSNKR